MRGIELLERAYAPLLEFADTVDERAGWLPTRLPGWAVRDLLFHLAADAQRALVAFGTPADGPPDTDAVSYWSHWQPGGDPTWSSLRATRTIASVWTTVRGPAGLFVQTARAVLQVFRAADPDAVLETQQHRLTVDSLLHTLAVEATVHHLDLEPVLPAAPGAEGLAAVREVLDGLLGTPAPTELGDIRYALAGTGRVQLTPNEQASLGELAGRFPLFG